MIRRSLTVAQLYRSLGFLLVLFHVATSQQPQNTTLRQVFVIFRNGLSTPTRVYPTDPYTTNWNKYGGLGQMQPAGLLQSYNFGQFLKNNYLGFLKPVYDPNRVLAKSVDIDRSIMSANLILSGAYPPANNDQIWSPSVSWFPIPVHTACAGQLYSDNCPKYDYLRAQQFNVPTYQRLQEANQDLLRSLSNFSGIDPLNYIDLSRIAESTITEQANNLTLPSWVSNNIGTILDANDYSYQFNYGQPEMARLTSGGILNDINSNIRKKLNGSLNEIVFYSVQSSHLVALASLLNLASWSPVLKQPAFGAAIIIELRQDDAGQYYIQVNVKNNSLSEKIGYNTTYMIDCGQVLCPLNRFLNLTSDKLVTDFNSDCYSLPTPAPTTVPPTTTTPTAVTVTGSPAQTTTSIIINPRCDPRGMTNLEIALAVSTGVLGLSTLVLSILVLSIIHKYKILKTVF